MSRQSSHLVFDKETEETRWQEINIVLVLIKYDYVNHLKLIKF